MKENETHVVVGSPRAARTNASQVWSKGDADKDPKSPRDKNEAQLLKDGGSRHHSSSASTEEEKERAEHGKEGKEHENHKRKNGTTPGNGEHTKHGENPSQENSRCGERRRHRRLRERKRKEEDSHDGEHHDVRRLVRSQQALPSGTSPLACSGPASSSSSLPEIYVPSPLHQSLSALYPASSSSSASKEKEKPQRASYSPRRNYAPITSSPLLPQSPRLPQQPIREEKTAGNGAGGGAAHHREDEEEGREEKEDKKDEKEGSGGGFRFPIPSPWSRRKDKDKEKKEEKREEERDQETEPSRKWITVKPCDSIEDLEAKYLSVQELNNSGSGHNAEDSGKQARTLSYTAVSDLPTLPALQTKEKKKGLQEQMQSLVNHNASLNNQLMALTRSHRQLENKMAALQIQLEVYRRENDELRDALERREGSSSHQKEKNSENASASAPSVSSPVLASPRQRVPPPSATTHSATKEEQPQKTHPQQPSQQAQQQPTALPQRRISRRDQPEGGNIPRPEFLNSSHKKDHEDPEHCSRERASTASPTVTSYDLSGNNDNTPPAGIGSRRQTGSNVKEAKRPWETGRYTWNNAAEQAPTTGSSSVPIPTTNTSSSSLNPFKQSTVSSSNSLVSRLIAALSAKDAPPSILLLYDHHHEDEEQDASPSSSVSTPSPQQQSQTQLKTTTEMDEEAKNSPRRRSHVPLGSQRKRSSQHLLDSAVMSSSAPASSPLAAALASGSASPLSNNSGAAPPKVPPRTNLPSQASAALNPPPLPQPRRPTLTQLPQSAHQQQTTDSNATPENAARTNAASTNAETRRATQSQQRTQLQVADGGGSNGGIITPVSSFSDTFKQQLKRASVHLNSPDLRKGMLAKGGASRMEQEKERRNNVVQEILSTERNYMRCLNVLVVQFRQPLWEALEGDSPILSKEDIKTIFSHIEVIFAYNSDLLQKLEDRVDQWDADSSVLGDIFLYMGDYLRVYANYVANYSNAQRTLKECKNNKRFQQFLQNVYKTNLEKKQFPGYEIESFLITPVQRIPRYISLLQALFRYTPEGHPDYHLLKEAVHKIEQVANDNEHRHNSSVNMTLLYHVQKRFIPSPHPIKLVSFQRVLLFEGDLMVRVESRDGTTSTSKRASALAPATASSSSSPLDETSLSSTPSASSLLKSSLKSKVQKERLSIRHIILFNDIIVVSKNVQQHKRKKNRLSQSGSGKKKSASSSSASSSSSSSSSSASASSGSSTSLIEPNVGVIGVDSQRSSTKLKYLFHLEVERCKVEEAVPSQQDEDSSSSSSSSSLSLQISGGERGAVSGSGSLLVEKGGILDYQTAFMLVHPKYLLHMWAETCEEKLTWFKFLVNAIFNQLSANG
ncbi:SH2 domain-containing protein [Balamuthia mandrillaris]